MGIGYPPHLSPLEPLDSSHLSGGGSGAGRGAINPGANLGSLAPLATKTPRAPVPLAMPPLDGNSGGASRAGGPRPQMPLSSIGGPVQGGSMQAPGGGGLLYPAPLRTPVGLDGASGISPRGQLTSSGGRPYPAPIMNLPRNTMDYNLHSLGGPDPLLPHLLGNSSSGGGGGGAVGSNGPYGIYNTPSNPAHGAANGRGYSRGNSNNGGVLGDFAGGMGFGGVGGGGGGDLYAAPTNDLYRAPPQGRFRA